MPVDPEQLSEENQRLKKELQHLQHQRDREKNDFEARIASERDLGKSHQEAAMQRTHELEAMKSKMVKLTRQLDEEVQKRDQVSAESQQLERRVQDLTKGGSISSQQLPVSPTSTQNDEQALRERGSQVSTKLMRVVDQWMRARDLQQALLRGASINDTAFATLVQALNDCPSLQTLDLSQNLLTMDSCSDLCQLITTAPSLSFISIAENLFSLRSVGYFMTVMERQNTKKLMPLDLLDLQGNEGLLAAAAAPVPEALLSQVQQATKARLPPGGLELVAQVMRALWRFLHDTAHPQVKDASDEEVAFYIMDKITLRKMENALMKILLLGADSAIDAGSVQYRPVTANLAFASTMEAAMEDARPPPAPTPTQGTAEKQRQGAGYPQQAKPHKNATQEKGSQRTADPFADLKTAFEPQREKLKTFNLKQIVTRNGTVLMNMLERLLETTEIDARDVETEQTLLEYACHTGNMGLAKLCYRRGANLSAKTEKGETAFNIVTKNKRYDLMEFFHNYGVKINSADSLGRTALHVAAENDDVDGVCRLIEWGADVNIRDNKKRTPIHVAAAFGNMKTSMLLLEVGADMNAKDDREYTAVAHAEAKNHFVLMDRLVQLGGRGHGLHQKKEQDLSKSKSAKMIGELVVSSGLLKSTSLGRIGKVAVKGMSGPLRPKEFGKTT